MEIKHLKHLNYQTIKWVFLWQKIKRLRIPLNRSKIKKPRAWSLMKANKIKIIFKTQKYKKISNRQLHYHYGSKISSTKKYFLVKINSNNQWAKLTFRPHAKILNFLTLLQNVKPNHPKSYHRFSNRWIFSKTSPFR